MLKQALTAYVDLLLVILLVIFAMFAIAVANMHEKAKAAKDAPISQTGMMQVMAIWPDDRCVDVDLWFQAPNDTIVGYSQKDGQVANLLRDDLGCTDDISGKNFEIVSTHGLPKGEYIINLHYFNDNSDHAPLPVHVVCQIVPERDSGGYAGCDETVTLIKMKEEETVIRITMDDQGHIVSTNKLPISLVGQIPINDGPRGH